MEYKAFLIKYAEIGLKGKNRYVFEDCLVSRIKGALKKTDGEFDVKRDDSRIFVYAKSAYDYDEVIEALSKVFGISGICPVVILEDTGFEDLSKAVVEYVDMVFEDKSFSFKVNCRRTNKSYPMTSMEAASELGGVILDAYPETKVDLHNPDVLLTVELRKNINIYSEEIRGPGGMPVGSAGRGMLLLSGGIDSPVAGYMVSKRGVTIDAVYFHAPPHTSERAKEKVVDLARIISAYTGPIRLHVVNFTDIQMYIYDECPHEELTIIMRRYMMRIAEHFAKENGALGLITGESIGQVASQTMQSLNCTNAVCELPVYRPLIAFDKQDIIDISEKIGTYETSILPYEDCCTIFVAKHPVTKPTVKSIEKSERLLSEKIDELVKTAIDTVEIIRVE
ncbi:MAG: tRNA 4-thiouridine(8) synthase ThiI [Lachnospiraceae bacterium]|nr:tRNA 4-thiouridine(8) synthase ThiI [Lachnospiraceae bacterium]